MTVDRKALRDRLYADAVAADLCVPAAFGKAKTTVCEDDIKAHVQKRAAAHRKELSAIPDVAELALKCALKDWEKSAVVKGSDKGPWRGVTLLTRAGKNLLQADGREMILRVDRKEPGREIVRWRYVSLAIPPSILISAASHRGAPVPARVRILHDSIAPDSRVAQNHVHHAALMSFEELWASLRLRALLRPGELVASLRDPRASCPVLHSGACPCEKTEKERRLAMKHPAKAVTHARHMAEWGDVIRQAFIASRLLDRHSYHRGNLDDCHDCKTVARTILRSFCAGRVRPYHQTATRYPWRDELFGLERRSREANAAALIERSDRLRTKLLRQQTAEERSLLARAFVYLRPGESESPDPLYETVFLQYLRVKTAVFGRLVHRPGERGLTNFLEHFRQIKVYAPESDFLRPQPPSEPGLQVRATEYRVAPDAWFKFLNRCGPEIEEGTPGKSIASEAAWLIHFKRKNYDGELPLYGSAIRTMESEADQIKRALAAKPTRLWTLCGIDLCGEEEAQPLWVSSETLRHVRALSRKVAGRRPKLGLSPLRLTLHAGEDFNWLTTGMRAIAEPFHWKLIERGDRIGHGIAITLDPEEWWERNKGEVMKVKRFDRLLDLAFLAEYAKERSPEQEKWLLREIKSTVKELRLETKNDTDLVKTAQSVWCALGRWSTRRLMRSRSPRNDTAKTPERDEGKRAVEREVQVWIHRYLWNRSTQERAREKIELRVDNDRNWLRFNSDRNECDLLVMARARLIKEMARWQVCIEVNPSSNLVVGGLDAVGAAQDFLERRPTRNLRQRAGHQPCLKPRQISSLETLTWTISTDDPITFSTTLADEYAYAWAGMVMRHDKPYDPSYARALLDEAAATSMRMRFTLPRHDRERKGRNKAKARGRARRH